MGGRPMSAGTNKIEFEVLRGWEQLPEGWSFVEVAGVATDSADRVYVFSRGEHPVLVFDRDGRFLDAWGEGVFTNAHGICIGPDDTVYCADNMDHTVRIFRPDGTLAADARRRPAWPPTPGFVAWTNPVETGGRAVQHGHQRGARARRPAVRGRRLRQRPGPRASTPTAGTCSPGASRAPGPASSACPTASPSTATAASTSPTARTPASRSSRPRASYVDEWTDVHRPDDVYIDADENLYVAELGFRAGKMPRKMMAPVPEHAPYARVSILTLDGEVQATLGGEVPCDPGSFFAPHGIWADSRGDLYVSEVGHVGRRPGRAHPHGLPLPAEVRPPARARLIADRPAGPRPRDRLRCFRRGARRGGVRRALIASCDVADVRVREVRRRLLCRTRQTSISSFRSR